VPQTHTRKRARAHAHKHTHTHTHTHTHFHTHTHTPEHTYTHSLPHTHTRTYTHTQHAHAHTTPTPLTRPNPPDVANAVLDGVDGILLGQETLRGTYPCESVETVIAICKQASRQPASCHLRAPAPPARPRGARRGVLSVCACSRLRGSWMSLLAQVTAVRWPGHAPPVAGARVLLPCCRPCPGLWMDPWIHGFDLSHHTGSAAASDPTPPSLPFECPSRHAPPSRPPNHP
jgi:hypothetical protein